MLTRIYGKKHMRRYKKCSSNTEILRLSIVVSADIRILAFEEGKMNMEVHSGLNHLGTPVFFGVSCLTTDREGEGFKSFSGSLDVVSIGGKSVARFSTFFLVLPDRLQRKYQY